jgi:hypothetical protein
MFALAQSGCGFLDFFNFHPHLLFFLLERIYKMVLAAPVQNLI